MSQKSRKQDKKCLGQMWNSTCGSIFTTRNCADSDAIPQKNASNAFESLNHEQTMPNNLVSKILTRPDIFELFKYPTKLHENEFDTRK